MNVTPKDIVARLNADILGVCRHLLPNGKRSGHEWEAGSVHGEEGKSLRVHLVGEKTGVWADFHAGDKGDVLDLWCEVRQIGIGQAIQEAKSYLGISAPSWHAHKPAQYRRPERPPAAVKPKPDSPVMAYLKGRGITEETLRSFKIAEEPGNVHFGRLADNPGTIVFPYLRDGELVQVKYLALARPDSKKQTLVEKNCEPCLFGWQALDPATRSVAICEGETDAMTLHQFGIQALSVPMGASNHQWVENEFDRLERFDQIFLCFDSDAAGKKGIGELIERLGRHRCRIVNLDYKDANECLMNGWGLKEFADAFMGSRYVDPKGLRNAAEFVNEVIAEFYPPGDVPLGVQTPWSKAGSKILFRSAEVSYWFGINGHGKTLLLNMVMANAMARGERVCIASLEMPPRRLLYRLTKQLSGLAEPAIPYIRQVHSWLEDKLWLFEETGTEKVDRLIEIFRYARQRYQVKQFVLDSLSKCGIGEDDYNGQKAAVEALCAFSHQFDCHVYVVGHARKGPDEKSKPGKMDAKGTGAITDMVDTVVSVWRNKIKENAIEDAEAIGDVPSEEQIGMPDQILTVCKQRNGDWEGQIALWFDPATLQYLGSRNEPPQRFVSFSNAESYFHADA
jgi:twinkle protein